jgi:hypothetical protein
MTRLMRRLLALPLIALGLVAAGCSSAEGQRAQELLMQAQAAEQNLRSASFELELNATLEGRQVGMTMRGGGYMKGRRAGDMFLEASSSGALPGFDFGFMAVDKRAYLNMNGGWTEMPFPASLQTQASSQSVGSAAFLELAQYVKKVKVAPGGIVDGDPTTTISGTVDTAGLVSAMAKLQGVTQLAGESAPDISQFADHLGDTRAAIAISDRTHLVTGAVVHVTIDAQGKQVDLQLVYRLRDVNKTVRFPQAS